MNQEIIVFIGILMGVACRTFIPFWQKWQEDRNIEFAPAYLFGAIFAGFAAFTSFVVIDPTMSMIRVFVAAAIYGYGWNSIVNRGTKK